MDNRVPGEPEHLKKFRGIPYWKNGKAVLGCCSDKFYDIFYDKLNNRDLLFVGENDYF